MKQPIRIIEHTPLGAIIEIIQTEVRLLIPMKILNQKIKEGIYQVKIDQSNKGERG